MGNEAPLRVSVNDLDEVRDKSTLIKSWTIKYEFSFPFKGGG